MAEQGAIQALVGLDVVVRSTNSRDTHYGRLLAVDDAFVVLGKVTWGWWGESGFWSHGKDDRRALPTCNVITITPAKAPR